MIHSVLFVHGTGVRKASYEFTFAKIAKGLDAIAPNLRLEQCLWGDAHGASFSMNGASIPDFTLEPAAEPDEDQMIALWELLARDPEFELRELAASRPTTVEAPSSRPVKAGMVAAFTALSHDLTVQALLEGHVNSSQWLAAHARLSNSDALRDALAATRNIYTPLRVAIARSLVAGLQQQLEQSNLAAFDKQLRDRIVDHCVAQLGEREAGGISDWFKSRLLGLALNWANKKAQRERNALFSATAPAAGDVVLYQARGQHIRDFIEERINDCGSNVAVVAHSLGGIACVDLLVRKNLPQVKMLVTVGSQAPFLYEIGALSSLEFGSPLPAHFPDQWLNFYDRNDLLSYVASKVFEGRATDIHVHSDLPFPQSHSAYWDSPLLWKTLKSALAA